MTVDVLSLPFLLVEERSALPDTAAIYFVLAGDVVLYVGQSVSLRQRWLAHHRLAQLNERGGCRIAWMHVDDARLLDELERACIEHFGPALNGTADLTRRPQVTVGLEPDDMARLEVVARRKRLPASILVRMWVMEQVEREEHESAESQQ